MSLRRLIRSERPPARHLNPFEFAPPSDRRAQLFAGATLDVDGRILVVCTNVVADLLAFVEATETSALNGADMYENVLTVIHGLNESETFSGIESLDRA